ncbi:hypothetical protein H9W95_19650 [Flavobacterium lindanitolerans]|nr:hypothetical protein [Flavobacterium lindanitolerans]
MKKKNVVSALLVMACFTGFAQDSKNKPFVASGKKNQGIHHSREYQFKTQPNFGF